MKDDPKRDARGLTLQESAEDSVIRVLSHLKVVSEAPEALIPTLLVRAVSILNDRLRLAYPDEWETYHAERAREHLRRNHGFCTFCDNALVEGESAVKGMCPACIAGAEEDERSLS